MNKLIQKIYVLIFLMSVSILTGNFHKKEHDMALVRWRPFDDMESLFELRPFFKDQKFDMYQQDGNVVVVMHVPGFDAEEISIEIDGNMLHIFAEQKEKQEVREKDYYRKEIKKGSFSRTVSLPCSIEEDAIIAEVHNGVLTITMPKAGTLEKETKKIKVKRR